LRTSSAFNQLGYFDDAFDLSESTPPAITIAYGVTQRDLVRALLITTAFVLLPLAFIAWMRAYALRNAATDPTAAWFSYFRTLHLTIQFATLAWIFADFHARNALSAWATYRWHLSTWTAVAADPLLMLGPIAALPVLSLLLSYDVFARIRRAAWGRPEFVAIH